jgi:hypothetical protein
MKKQTVKPAAPKPAVKSKRLPILEYIAELDGDTDGEENEGEEGEGEGKVKRIVRLYIAGYSAKEICGKAEKGGAGFNKSTTYRQIGEYKKLLVAPALTFGTTGFQLYEARIQRMMQAKKVTREKAVEIITQKDAE